MTSDIVRIRRNWASAIAASDIVGQLFYEQLFEIAPSTRPLFPASLDDQGRKLVQTLSWIVDHLDQTDDLVAGAQALALRHINYGVAPGHYSAVGIALIATLKASLGDDFHDEDEAAWVKVYGSLSNLMIDTAYSEDT